MSTAPHPRHAVPVRLSLLALLAASAPSVLAAGGPPVSGKAAGPAGADQALQAVLDAIDADQVPDDQQADRLLRGLGPSGWTLSKAHADRVWAHYEKVGASLDAPKVMRGKASAATYTKASGAMARTMLYWGLVQRMEPEHVRAVRAAESFPGKVPDDAKPVRRTIAVPARLTRWHSTGLYAAPGATITVTVGDDAINMGLGVQIGCHKDHLGRADAARRWPAIVLSRPIRSARTCLASPFGGLVYITVPSDANASLSVQVTIDGAVEAPRFVLGETLPDEWKRRIRSLPGPWAEFESDKLVATVPASLVRDIDDPTKVVAFWKRVADAQDDLTGREPPRYKERMVCDTQISAGALHSGYPMMGHLGNARDLVDYEKVSARGTWGWFHELGHNHQRSPWRTPVEVTVNILSMYTMETVVGLRTEDVDWYRKCIPAVRKFYADGPVADKPAWNDGFTLPLAMFMHMRKEFGWDLYKTVFRQYERMDRDKWPRAEQDQRDLWMVLTSTAAGKDLTPFYDRWGFTTTDAAKAKVASLPKWDPKEY